MTAIGPNTIADLFFQLSWHSSDARHTDAYAGRNVNFWRDLLPRRLMDELWHLAPGDQSDVTFAPGELFTNGNARNLRRISHRQFDPTAIGAPQIPPRKGRFYPRGLLKGMIGIFTANREPFRVTGVAPDSLTVDLGHPLAETPLQLNVTVGMVSPKNEERGGTVQHWMENLTYGTGMQARWQNHATDYFSDAPFTREDETDDTLFYAKPRLVDHMDDAALNMVRQLYGRFIRDDMRILDLMSSWHSHLPHQLHTMQVSGIGMNEHELRQNTSLTDYLVQDLNRNPVLPYPSNHYDVAICTASVEYLTDPMSVLAEAARALRPGGRVIITFSNRWFPPKVIRLWTELHEFERMGLVLEYLRGVEQFTDLQTYSIRGLMRPRHDKYYGQRRLSDPVYAVWATKV